MRAFNLFFIAATILVAPVGHARPGDDLLDKTAPFLVPALPFAAASLEPVVDSETMQIHHDKHHQAYVDNLNKAIKDSATLRGLTLEQLLASSDSAGTAVRNNAGGHYNHSLFWSLLAPPGEGAEPSQALLTAIERDFGSLQKFKEEFSAAALSVFGSGWAWLVLDRNGSLIVTVTPNQDNPLMPSAKTPGFPLLALDVWEHAYYLNYQNKRPAYVQSWWSVVNWAEVSKRFKSARDVRRATPSS
ncbi:superoxide dismutase [Stenotrophomonas sp. S39]|uniref:superoxide dismutase n=1 Tax=Stenotrophomonas sp. S39 TaxID=2767451 RepID=UPI00190B430E|nr:superoxide dismutase [Stenotrophomonas sp. S39]MBK0052685.1 superoxide dismutase [Stenotrophomonas sp. S39]